MLRDAEVESIIRSYADPLFRAGGIPPASVRIRVINDPSLNAFATSGSRMYIHSGLLERTENPEQLIGVIAHETGHIAGGHIVNRIDALEKAGISSLAALAAGIAIGAASGRPDAGLAVTSLGTSVATRNYFSFSRTQEASADAFALKVLDKTGQTAEGLLEFFHILEGQEYLASANQDPYVRTHPLNAERISAVAAHVEQSSAAGHAPTAQMAAHKRMVAKMFAFLQTQGRTLQKYPETDQSVAGRYARAIAYFRRGNTAKSLPLIDGLLKEYPSDPYFHELRGQMLVENGRVVEGLPNYRKAVSLLPNEPLIATSYGHALIESGSPEALKEAAQVLRTALARDPENSFGWRLLGTAWGRTGNEGQASYALAEYALQTGEPSQASFHAGKAEKLLGQNHPLWLRLQDIKMEAQNQLDKK
ncbi:peptidase M48 [Haematospirillum jordaniae]|uniref:Peptidase M48 n=1 Tax=Haematospirillum jordaniae TaxID=1549855 RepID=A0A143DHB4_9PROT|nr:peptidase M48 [Haematospirillum jordaniae]